MVVVTVAIAPTGLGAQSGAPPALLDQRRIWYRAGGPVLQVVSDAGRRDTEALADRVQALSGLFAAIWPTTPPVPRPIVVVALRDPSDVDRLLPDAVRSSRHARRAGMFVRGLDRDYVSLGLPGSPAQRLHVLAHEFGHALVDRHLERLPVWLDEGLAELLARGGSTSDATDARLGHVRMLAAEPLLPLAELLAATRESAHYTQAGLAARFYAQAWSLVHYLIVADGGARADRLTTFVALLRRGMTDIEAARAAFGDLRQLDQRLRAYVATARLASPLVQPLPQAAGAASRARRLSVAEASLMLGDFLEHSGRADLAVGVVERAAGSGAAAEAAERLSLGLFRRRRFVEAEATAIRALESSTRLAVAHYVAGAAIMAQSPELSPERADRAESHLRTAIRLNPALARAHAVLGGLLATARRRPSDGLVFARQAMDLDPADVANQVALAQVLLLDGQAPEARWLAARIVRHAASPSEQAIGERLVRLAEEAAAATRNAQRPPDSLATTPP